MEAFADALVATLTPPINTAPPTPSPIPHPEQSLTLEQMLDALAKSSPSVFQPGIQLPPEAPFSDEEAPTIKVAPTYQEKEIIEMEIQAGQVEQHTQVTQSRSPSLYPDSKSNG